MKYIEVSDEEFEILKRMAIPYMEPEDTINDGIRKLIRDKLGIEGVREEERTIENFLSEIPEPYRYLAEDLIGEIRNIGGVKVSLPTPKAWAEGYRWVSFKKANPKGKREIIGWIEPRRYGFYVSVYDPQKRDYRALKIGKDVTIPGVKEDEAGTEIFVPMMEEEIKSTEEYSRVKKMIVDAFTKAYQEL